MIGAKLLALVLLASTALAGRIKYEVRIFRESDRGYTTRSKTLDMPDRYLDLITNNIRTWSQDRFRASRPSERPYMVVITICEALQGVGESEILAMQQEMAMVVLCNIPGDAGAASIQRFDRRRDCKKPRRKGSRLEA